MNFPEKSGSKTNRSTKFDVLPVGSKSAYQRFLSVGRSDCHGMHPPHIRQLGRSCLITRCVLISRAELLRYDSRNMGEMSVLFDLELRMAISAQGRYKGTGVCAMRRRIKVRT